jgi:hypothetical protein
MGGKEMIVARLPKIGKPKNRKPITWDAFNDLMNYEIMRSSLMSKSKKIQLINRRKRK